MWLRKLKGGTGIGPYSWPEDGSACEVPDELGREILNIPGHDFTRLAGPPDKPKPAAPKAAETPDGDA